MLWLLIVVAFSALQSYSNACDCGLENLSTRVYKGNETTPNRYPWLVHIKMRNEEGTISRCGGTLIDDQHVITAAHCVIHGGKPREAKDILILLGAHSLSDIFAMTGARVESIKFDMEYMDDERGLDIALIKLVAPIRITSSISPICVWKKKLPPNAQFVVVGWGVLGPGLIEGADTPYEATIDYISNKKCNQMKEQYYVDNNYVSSLSEIANLENYKTVPKEEICAFNLKTHSDACCGDSGGPLMYRNEENGRWYLVGVVSRGWDECGTSEIMPGIYTAVRPHLDTLFKSACFNEH